MQMKWGFLNFFFLDDVHSLGGGGVYESDWPSENH